MNRELSGLMGERAPPVAVYDEKLSYKAKRNNGPAKKWYMHHAIFYICKILGTNIDVGNCRSSPMGLAVMG
jgi:hypothetical protein